MRRFDPVLLVALTCSGPALAGDWTPVEREEAYAVSGTSGIELYESIGRNGPGAGKGTAIAHTTFDLKWSRDYRPQPDGSCTLVAARPALTITYTLPKPSKRLSGTVATHWETFIAGIRAHEKVHGRQIVDMVERILATTVGVTVPDDPGCRKVREAIKTPLTAASQEQRRQSRAFDRTEMADGGAVHRLVLDLVNGR